MSAGKSTNLLQVAHNYESNGLEVLLIKPQFDTRDKGLIRSRLGIERCADIIAKEDDNIFSMVKQIIEKRNIECILVDEVSFLTKRQARELWRIAVELDTVVIAYGLRVDYMGEGFESSKELLVLAHEIEELKTIDETGKKCTMHLRKVNDEYVFSGKPRIVGDIKGEEKYESVTAETWLKEYERYKTRTLIDSRGGMCR